MKTFETEKHNIPEGATHYSEEDKRNLFTWFKVGDTVEFFSELTGKWQLVGAHINCLKVRITPIPKPEVVEWKNGDECLIENSQGYVVNSDYERYVGSIGVVRASFETQGGVKMVAVQHCSGDCVCWREEMLSKPESPEEKEQRERLEAAYDLYLTRHATMTAPYHYDEFLKNESTLSGFLAIVDKTNYRKGE